MRFTSLALALGALALPTLAQMPRPSRQIDHLPPPTVVRGGPAVASVGNLTASVFVDDTAGVYDVWVTTSVDHGLTWNPPVRVDNDPTGGRKSLRPWSVRINGQNIYVAWLDERISTSNDEVYTTHSPDGGVTWAPEQPILPPFPSGVYAMRDWRFVIEPNLPADDLYFLLSVDPTGSLHEELYLVANVPGTPGAFLPPVYVPALPPQVTDHDGIDLAVSLGMLHVAFIDDRSGADEVWYQQSLNRGQVWAPVDVQIDNPLIAGDAENDVVIAADGPVVAVAWQDEIPNATGIPEQLHVNVSMTGGASWNGDVLVGTYLAGVDDVDNPAIGVTPVGTVVVAWEDDRTGSDEIYTANCIGGMVWSPDQPLSFGGGAGYPRMNVGRNDTAAVAWTGGGFPEQAWSAVSHDGGMSWNSILTSDNVGFDVDYAELAFNAQIENVVLAYLSDDLGVNHLYTAGYSALVPAGCQFYCGSGINLNNYTIVSPFSLSGVFQGTVAYNPPNVGAVFSGYLGVLIFPIWGQEGLVNITTPEVLGLPAVLGPAPAVLTWPVPQDPAYAGFHVFTQAAGFGGGLIQLTCAWDCTVGW